MQMTNSKTRTLNILVADDDVDDRFFLGLALKEVSIPFKLTSVSNGQQLIDYLASNPNNLPDVVILDLNMPLKNGNECVIEIKRKEALEHVPIIIYSTSLQDEVADILYQNGAHYYLRKTDISALVPHLNVVLHKLYHRELERPPRNKFILNPKEQRSTEIYGSKNDS